MQMIRVLSVSLLFVLSNPSIVVCQTISSAVTVLSEQIADSGSLGFDHDAQYNRFVKLTTSATDEELVLLTDHTSPAVRGYAFWALAKRKYADLKSIFVAHLDDKSPVLQKNGCMVGNESVISFMRQVVTPYMYDPDCMKLDDKTRAMVQ